MPTNGKEYKLAIRIAGVVDKSLDLALANTGTKLSVWKTKWGKMDSVFKEMDKGFDSAMKVGKKCFNIIEKAAEAAALAIGGVTIAAAKIGSDFEAEMSVVQAISQATDKDLDALAKKAREVGKTSVFSATEVGKGMEYMGMAGWKTEEILAGIGGVVDLAAASGEDMANVSSIVVDTLTAMGRTADDTGEFVDVLAQAAMNSNTNVELMGDTFKYAAPVAGALGYNFKDLAIATGLMASSGIKGSLAGTALRNMLTRMAKPTKESRDAMEKLGLSLEDEEGKAYSLMDIMLKLRSSFAESTDPEGMASALSTLGGLTDEQIEEYKSGIGEMSAAEEAFLAAELGGLRGMSGLLALANSSDEQFQQLAESIYGADGAVGKMASVRLNNLQGDLTILKDAARDAGIEFYYQFNDELRDAVQYATEIVDDAAVKIPEFFKEASEVFPTVLRQIKKYAVPVFDFLYDAGKWIVKNGKTIISVIAGIGATMAVYKVASTVSHIVMSLLKVLSLGPVGWIILGIASAIAVLTGALVDYKITKEELISEDLANHFGDIALSMEDLSSVADYIVQTKNLEKVKEILEAFQDLNIYSDEMGEAVKTLNKLNWKVSIGMALTPEEEEAYKEAINAFVSGGQEYITQEQYAMSLGLNLLLDPDNPKDEYIQYAVNKFYESNLNEFQSLGEQLASAVEEGFKDGFTLSDVETIAKIQQQMADVQRALAVNDYDVALTMLGSEFSGKKLTPDAFLNLQEKLNEASGDAIQAYRESYAKTQTAFDKLYLSGESGLSKQDYESISARNKAVMENGIAETISKALEFQLNTIYDTYGEDIETYKQIRDDKIQEWSKVWDNNEHVDMNMAWNYLNGMIMQDESLTDAQRGAIERLAEGLLPQVEELDYILNNYKLDEETQNKLKSFKDLLGPLFAAGTYWDWGASEFSNELGKDVFGAILESGDSSLKDFVINNYTSLLTLTPEEEEIVAQEVADSISNAYVKGLKYVTGDQYLGNTNLNLLPPTSLWKKLSNPISPTYKDTVDNADLTLEQIMNSGLTQQEKNDYIHKINGHASGGFIWNRELSWLGEKGPEAVIPLDGSDRAASLWEQAGKLLGMGSLTDRYDFSGLASGSGAKIEYSPTLQFYGEAPSRQDLDDALRMSQDEFEAMMEQYLKRNSRVAFR